MLSQELRCTRRGETTVRDAAGSEAIPGTVALRSFTGARVQYVVRVAGDVELVAEAPLSSAEADLAPGTAVALSIDPTAVFAMPQHSGGRS
ncbi:TOBE domain-containing protein [Chelatococcus sp. SYSU_G07232]|uniref:TOBE domain-containing protein n=1 Tax=Chelatococcus albus TaxID=3047466 RepID=A0ABT7AKE9_9HYPH|nr:TOBE domain-containing protein [Chelatococcus sp. SYSU_G07232]MDJ1159595.1 TOBE domain-containing protein [Chelatococcus sp. SYSU_G07232]